MSHDPIDDIRNVGPQKPVGYWGVASKNPQNAAIARELQARGLHVVVLDFDHPGSATSDPEEINKINSGVMYVADIQALDSLLGNGQNPVILAKAGWPRDPIGFLMLLHWKFAPEGTDIYKLIAKAFGQVVTLAAIDQPRR